MPRMPLPSDSQLSAITAPARPRAEVNARTNSIAKQLELCKTRFQKTRTQEAQVITAPAIGPLWKTLNDARNKFERVYKSMQGYGKRITRVRQDMQAKEEEFNSFATPQNILYTTQDPPPELITAATALAFRHFGSFDFLRNENAQFRTLLLNVETQEIQVKLDELQEQKESISQRHTTLKNEYENLEAEHAESE